MNIKLLFFSFGLLLFWQLAAYGQTTNLKGFVKDSKSNQSIDGATIYFPTLKLGCISELDGLYKVDNIPFGKYKVVVKHIGYITLGKEIEISKAKENNIDFSLEMEVKELLGIEIKNDLDFNQTFIKITIKKSNIEENSVRDIGELLRTIPNIQAVRKGGANLDPVIRGFKFDQLNVQLDNGMTVEGGCPNRMDPTTSHVEAEDIESIEVLKGPFTLRYGPVMGGVVNLNTLNPRPFDKFEIHVKGNISYESNWNGTRQHFAVLGGNKKFFFTFTGNNSVYDDYEDGENNSVPSSFRKFGVTGKLGFAIKKNQIITASYSEFYARNISFPTLPMDERKDNTKLYSLDYKARNISKLIETINIKSYFTDVDHTMDNYERSSSDSMASVSHILATRLGYRAEIGLNAFTGHLFVGTDFYKINKDGDRVKNLIMQMPTSAGVVPIKVEDLWNKAVINDFGFFSEYTKRKGSWEYVGAVRIDYNSAFCDSINLKNTAGASILRVIADSTISSYLNFSFSLGATKMLSEKMSL